MRTDIVLWPARPRPLDGETFASWFLRLAEGNGLTPRELYRAVLPGAYLYSRDLDRLACADLMAELSRRTGVPLEDLRGLTFARWCGSVFQEDDGHCRLPWLSSVTREKGRKSFGQQFCPHCLAEDEVPYLRAEWRLSFVTVCARHGTTLCDRCVHCAEPVQPLKLIRRGQQLLCPDCLSPLDKANPSPASASDIELQKTFLQVVEDGWSDLPGWGPLHAVAFFQLARILLRLLASGPFARALRLHLAETVQERHELAQIPLVKEGDLLAPERRLQLLRLIGRLLESWPCRFVDACRAIGVSQWHLLTDIAEIPFVFRGPVVWRLSAGPRRMGADEFREAADYLRRHGQAPTFGALTSLFHVEAEAARQAAEPAFPHGPKRQRDTWRVDGVAPEVRDAVRALAHRDGEHVSGWLERLVRRELHVRGVVFGSSES